MNKHCPVKSIKNDLFLSKKNPLKNIITKEIVDSAINFHKNLPDYRVSPLKSLTSLSDFLGLGGIWVKDESERLALNSFKILGGSFAVYKYLKKRFNLQDEISFMDLKTTYKNELESIVLATATDGNHGRGVAWIAQKLGIRSIVYVHKNTSKPRINAIKNYGAKIEIIDGTYDEAVSQIKVDAEKNGWQIISDTSWDGYEEIPTWIMQGYSTMYSEIQRQLAGLGIVKPTHVFVQAGVGSLAASVVNFYTNVFKEQSPIMVIVEPENANCIYRSAMNKENDYKAFNMPDIKHTIMAGLECGNPNPIAWEILKEQADYYFTCPDYVAAKGMRVYGVPLKGDPMIISGESGAVTLGALFFVMKEASLEGLREKLNLNADSQVLLINTEGNTDPVHFKQIVWDGLESVPDEFKTII